MGTYFSQKLEIGIAFGTGLQPDEIFKRTDQIEVQPQHASAKGAEEQGQALAQEERSPHS